MTELRTLDNAVDAYRTWRDSPSASRKVRFTGHWADRAYGPFRAGTMLVVGARTNVGKTQFLLSLATAYAGTSVLVACEDGVEELGRRVEGMPAEALSRVQVATPSYPKLESVLEAIRDAHGRYGAQVALVDYAQAVTVPGMTGQLAEGVKHLCHELKGLARELEMVLVLASQLRRPAAGEAEGEPTLWQLRDGSSLENMADGVVLLSKVDDFTLKAKVGKNKWGPVGAEQLYARDPRNGWLHEAGALPADEDGF